ncbi:hypothetical protein DXC26_14905 [Clostridiaceae bacterium OM08-6BH]|nr:hypothetical protein DXC26_14905 [Clostridiaceae bacterium OM08-6BH]
MTKDEELSFLNAILDFQVPIIPETTRFWMVRTQRGYFYNEFVTRRFVALAWNNIDSKTDFSESSKESLKDDILMEYEEISRPSMVINKCITFINEIKEGDILVIPSAGSKYITFALAGKYFEDNSKTVELEHTIIYRIKNHDVDINDVSCPYKKRRHITLLRTITNEELNYSLGRAISNYHGVSNLDTYARQILNSLYNYYIFNNDISLVYNVKKTDPITPRELNSILYGTTEIFADIAPEECLSTQITLNSPGEIVFNLKDVLNLLKDNWQYFFGMLIFLGGGSVLTFKVPGAIDVIKSIINIPNEQRIKEAEAQQKEIEIYEKKLELYQKIKASGIDPEALSQPLNALISSCNSLNVEPIVVDDASAAILPEEVVMPESHDADEE